MILTRYIGKDLLASTIAITIILLLIIVSGRFVGYVADAAAGDIPADLLGYVFIYTLPSLFQLVLPLGFFVAVMLVYGQLYVDSEMIVMQACGLSQARLLLTALLPATVIALIVAYCSLIIAPSSEARLRAQMEKPESTAAFSTLVGGKFQYVGNGITVYVKSLNDAKTEMYDVFLIQSEQKDSSVETVIARAARATVDYRFDGARYLVLHEGYQFQTTSASLQRTRIQFASFAIKLPESKARDIKPASVDVIPSSELLGATQVNEIAALQWRISMPLMVLVMAVAGFSLSRTTHRKGRYGKLLPGVFMFFMYFTLLSVSRDAVEDKKLTANLGLWWVHAVMIALAAWQFSGKNPFSGISLRLSLRKVES